MVQVLQRHKIIVFIFALFILAGIIWAVYSGHASRKVPMRGVYVMEYIKNIGDSYEV